MVNQMACARVISNSNSSKYSVTTNPPNRVLNRTSKSCKCTKTQFKCLLRTFKITSTWAKICCKAKLKRRIIATIMHNRLGIHSWPQLTLEARSNCKEQTKEVQWISLKMSCNSSKLPVALHLLKETLASTPTCLASRITTILATRELVASTQTLAALPQGVQSTTYINRISSRYKIFKILNLLRRWETKFKCQKLWRIQIKNSSKTRR